MAILDEESQQLQEGAVKTQETNKQECATQESDDCIQNNAVEHVAPQVCIIASSTCRPATEGAWQKTGS